MIEIPPFDWDAFASYRGDRVRGAWAIPTSIGLTLTGHSRWYPRRDEPALEKTLARCKERFGEGTHWLEYSTHPLAVEADIPRKKERSK